MRESKFRAYRMGVMYDVVEWNFEGKQDILLRDKDGNEIRDWLKNVDIMQYTGLKDKNGKDIYEKAILKDWGGIVFEVGFWDTDADTLDSIRQGLIMVEVIGTIYENPKLLKEGNE